MSDVRVHRLRVAEVVTETHDSRSLVFDLTPSQLPYFGYRPGQFLTLRVPDGDCSAARCYSLASSPHTGERLKVTVKRVSGGLASNWLCDHVRPGAEIETLEPSGVFTPRSFDEDHLLFAAGSGITPVMSILKSLLARGTGRVFLWYANRGEDDVIFKAELNQLQAGHPERLVVMHWLESVQGLPTAPAVRAAVAPLGRHQVFVCGPKPFMDVIRTALRELDFPRSLVRLERFTSLGGDPFARATPPRDERAAAVAEVELAGTVHVLPWPRQERLLDVLRDGGLDAPASCAEGVCASCECRVVDGEVTMVNNQVLEEDDLAQGYVLACQALPVTDRVRITYS